jgi:hypothetical protein
LAKGEIHDLGYQRYVGARRPPSTRWRVIMRHQISTAWKGFWRFKAGLGYAVVMTAIFGGVMFLMSNKIFQMGGASSLRVFWSEAALPMSIEWFCRAGFYLSLTLGAGAIAGDLQSGAFTFYFARSTRPWDYIIGKISGYGVLVCAVTVAPLVVLAGVRLGISDTTAELVEHLTIVPKTIAVGGVIALAYTVIPLGFSALLPDRRNAIAAWAAFYLVFGFTMWLIARVSGGSLGVLDIPTACVTVAFDWLGFAPIFGHRPARQASGELALISILVQAGLAILILWLRVSRAQKSGVGGSS